MNYATLDEYGEATGERSYDPPLGEQEIEFWPNGVPKIAPLLLAEAKIDPETHKQTGFTYYFTGGQVIKRAVVVPLSEEEIKARRNAEIKDRRLNSLPTYDDVVELLTRALLGVIEKQAMMEDPKDPRTKSLVRREDVQKLKSLLAICENNVLEP